MIQFKYFLLVVLLLCASLMFAQNVAIGFKDTTTGTKTAVNLEFGGTGYPFPTPSTGFDKWLVQFYKSTDDVIDPLDANGNPTNDDIEVIAIGNYTQYLSFGPTGALALSACTITPVGSTGNTHIGDKIYVRIFNHNLKASATKSLPFTALYLVLSTATQNVTIIPTYGWGTWTTHVTAQAPNPVVLVAPLDASTGLAYAGQTLSWSASTTGSTPDGYKVYFGENDNPAFVIDQPGTTYDTGSLFPNLTYYWKIVPYNVGGEPTGVVTWSFTTRDEFNPGHATNPSPADDSVVDTSVMPFTQILTWLPPVGGVPPTGYKFVWNSGPAPLDLGNVLTTNVLITDVGEYNWQIIPYYIDPGTGSVRLGDPITTRNSTNSIRGDAIDCPVWSFSVNYQAVHTLAITSTPEGARIIVNGEDSGEVTPHTFTVNEAASINITLQKDGYTWSPESYTNSSVMSNESQHFVGTLLSYDVVLSSTPTGAEIFKDGVSSGYNTPHTFSMDYGTSATYSVGYDGYDFNPDFFYVTNIQDSTSKHFSGTIRTYVVQISSNPSGAAIYSIPGRNDDRLPVIGTDTGFTTPHQFVLNHGTSITYYVQKAGYTWSPVDFNIINIQDNTSQVFTGTIITYTVNISSIPSDADIYIDGVDSGHNTPYEFIMNYGTSATYKLQKTAFSWSPDSLLVENIQDNVTQLFTGTQTSFFVDITSNPTGADIYIDDVDTGYNTPYQFLMPAGTSAVYTVQKDGYNWTPISYTVNDIDSDRSQNFTGELKTYTVNLTSIPSDADILIDGVDSGNNTPYQFVLNYGTSVTYSVQKAGYTWSPVDFNITNIQANADMEFMGTLLNYTVDITSEPNGAYINVNNGRTTLHTTPHQFIMDYGTSATFSLTKEGYDWSPTEFVVTNIQANTSRHFVGTLKTYTVEITSIPSDAIIFIDGVDSGYTTPKTFTMNYGSSAVYTVQKTGYTWLPENLTVTNIQANIAREFAGTQIAYAVEITSIPSDAAIFVDGIYSGHNTPYEFAMLPGTNAEYTVQKAGYTWAPASFAVQDIQASTSQNFVGTLIPYNVSINSSPSNANIFVNGIDSGFTTPYTFVMNYGTNATYTVQKAGYSWNPASFVVTNIQDSTSVDFIGTLLTYTVDITSNPDGAAIYTVPSRSDDDRIIAEGTYTGFTTPHQFVLTYGSSRVYYVQKAGYTWSPVNFNVSNIQANTGQLFTGTLLTYTVNITSNPSNADIFIDGVDSGYNTPHEFVMNYGSNAVYTVQKAGYTWEPASFTVTNIQANTSREFIGSIISYDVAITSTPSNAYIYIDGQYSGFETPHIFQMNYGTSATYLVHIPGYTWSPTNFVVNNIQTDLSTDFTGTIITYNVNITSNPIGANILVNGQSSGHVTPHNFVMNYGTGATYSVQKTGYTWEPNNFVVSNIQANAEQNFVGTLITYDVNITSNPTGAAILVNGQNSGHFTPHHFTMNYGTSATYSVQKEGYTFNPNNFTVENIIENAGQNFVGTIITYTVNITSSPEGADIYIQPFGTIENRNGAGNYTGYSTPHEFVLEYGTSFIYYVQKAGYTWSPESAYIEYIQANTSRHFTGTIITYTVDINSNPADADIFINGQDSGFNTPYQFVMNYGASASYTVQKEGYGWNPQNFVVSNIQSNMQNNFVGSILTYNVDIASNPSNADIFINGQDSGFNTPYQFVMNYGSNATYSVQKEGYIWSPNEYAVTYIQSNKSQMFNGTILTFLVDITSTPAGADILVNGISSGFTTPSQLVMDYGTNATITVQKAGYTWTPQSYQITNLQSNLSRNFTGTIITYTVNIQSDPTNADIYLNGQYAGFRTPHQFVMNYGTNAVYAVQKDGYYWNPTNLIINNIQSNITQLFTGTMITYNVNITSSPDGAAIYDNGINTGFVTPHQFVLAQGASAIYTLQKAGYSYSPNSYAVGNIQADTSQHFTGTLLTYNVNITSNPSGAKIYVNGEYGGLVTPQMFTLSYGSNATYFVQKDGYTWSPQNFVVNSIQTNMSQNFVGTILTYTVDIASNPIDADIFVNGQDTGFNTPHQFVLNYGSNATYTVQKAGYSWTPQNLVVNNIQANTGQLFTGSILTYTVDIISNPIGADILVNGVDSGFDTPHQFVMNYGASAAYAVQKTGFAFTPFSYAINNIQANTVKNFVGSLLTYSVNITSTPTEADIYINGVDSGFNTPYSFTQTYGSNATYSVQKAGYTFDSEDFVVTNIQANTNWNFLGTILTYTVDITSTPIGADILVNGQDTGFDTPHQFVMNYGTSAVYTLQKAGFTWMPASFSVNNIQSDTGRNFIGSQITYTVTITSDPSGADVYLGNEDTGLNTPCQLVLPQGANALVKVKNPDYSWSPDLFDIINIQENLSQHFIGTMLAYNVMVTSNPTDADIYINGEESEFNTPHMFVMNSGTSAIYTIHKDGYSWNPVQYAINNIRANANLVFSGNPLTYTVNITSLPPNADIFINGIDSGYNTPKQFTMNYGTSAIYSVQQAGYSWAPGEFSVVEIMADTSMEFIGTQHTYTVDIISNPADADIFIDGIDTGFNTPYQFVMNHGSSAIYTVQKIGYAWNPERLIVDNIQANITQEFIGSPRSYTVYITSNPTNATILLNGQDTGFTTPREFVLNHGAGAIYSVQLQGYVWSPPSYTVTNIQSNLSQHFTGTQLLLAVTPANRNVNNQAGSTSFTVNANIAWTVSESISWLSVTPASSINNGTINVNYEANPTSMVRTGQITVSGSGITGYVTVTQSAGQPNLTVSPAIQNVAYQAGTTTFAVSSNVTWTVNESISWLSLTPAGGSNNGIINVSYLANTSTNPRSGLITITGNGITRTITVTQAGSPAMISVTPQIQNVSYAQGTTMFTVTSNVAWSISESVNWLSVSPASGSNNGSFIVTYNANTINTARNGLINITGSGVTQTVTVNQAAAPAYLNVNPLVQNVSNPAGNTSFTVSSNTNWTVMESESWLHVTPANGSLNGAFTVTYEANPTTSPRTGTVTIIWGDSELILSINQSSGVGTEDQTEIPLANISVYPNPFASTTNIKLNVTDNHNTDLTIYSSKGELVRSMGVFNKGSHKIAWDGKDKNGKLCSNGFYFIRYKSADLTKTVKVLLIKN